MVGTLPAIKRILDEHGAVEREAADAGTADHGEHRRHPAA
jgi:hypothetical protein